MVEIKYEITTNLSVGKDSKFRVFWTRHFALSTLISLTKNSKVWHRIVNVFRKIRTLMWCLGCSGLSFGPLLIRSNLSWYLSNRGTAPGGKVEITYLDCIVMSLQKIYWYMTIKFRHISLKNRHKTVSMTISNCIMYWASQITSCDVS